MKENEEYTNNNIDTRYERSSHQSIFENQNELISPFNSEKKNIQQDISYLNYINNISNNEINPSPNDYNNYTFYNNSQCTRENLTDEQKKYYQPKDSSFLDKLLDFLFNW